MQLEMMTRRATLSGAAAAIVATAAPVAASAAMPDDANRIWADHTALLGELRHVDREIDAAAAQLPTWAAPGPKYVDHRGRQVGHIIRWPMVAEFTLPREGTQRIVRVSPEDVRQWSKRLAPVPRAAYRKRMREVIGRVRAQRAEEERVGLPRLIEHAKAIDGGRTAIARRIEALPPSPNATAAVMLHWIEENDAFTVREGLRKLRPLLTGLIADHTDWLIQHPRDADISLAEAPFHYWSEHV